MARKLEQLRNIGIIAHIDAGKTTLTERMLFYAGATHRMGDVDKGTTETDFDEEEQQRGITIYSACVTFDWKDVHVNLIDTPGHVDFTAEVERSLRVLDGGVVVFSAREGVEAQSETVWRQANKYHVPRIAFVNKMDRDGADFYRTLAEMEKRLDDSNLAVVNIPVGAGPPHLEEAFSGVIDLISMKLLIFDSKEQGKKIEQREIPAEYVELAREWRNNLLEKLYEFSDDLIQLSLEEAEVPEELVRKVLRAATIHDMIVPVLCGTALDYAGVQPVLDAVQYYLPSPADLPPVEGVDPKDAEKKLTRKADENEPFCGLVFKIVADKHGDMCYVRIYSGTLKSNTRVYNPGQDKKDNASQLWHIQAGRREQVDQVTAGDIVGVIGLRHSVTGDTLTLAKEPILLEAIEFPETVISMAIEPETSTERKKLSEVLEMMKRQDPTFLAKESEETGQTIISGMGELHLEVIKNKLLRDFKLDVKVHNPRVSYRETVKKSVEVTGQCNRQIAGQQHTAKVTLKIEPSDNEHQPVGVYYAAGESIPPDFIAPVMDALEEQGQGGGLLGFPLMKVKVSVIGGEAHETDSNDLAFTIATSDAFRHALDQAGNVLLEPIMKLEVITPEEYLGDFVSDLQQRRAIITSTVARGKNTVIEAQAPLASLFGYSSAMRSLSQGRANCSMEPSEYGPAPEAVLASYL